MARSLHEEKRLREWQFVAKMRAKEQLDSGGGGGFLSCSTKAHAGRLRALQTLRSVLETFCEAWKFERISNLARCALCVCKRGRANCERALSLARSLDAANRAGEFRAACATPWRTKGSAKLAAANVRPSARDAAPSAAGLRQGPQAGLLCLRWRRCSGMTVCVRACVHAFACECLCEERARRSCE